jgi:hypothetical protein
VLALRCSAHHREKEERAMTKMAQPVMTGVFTDPSNVAEVFANGPITFNVLGPCATVTFTTIRGDLQQMADNQQVTKCSAVVVSRVAMPLEIAAELRNLLNRMILDQPPGFGPSNLRQ